VVVETFFYLLDVATANALVLYNEGLKIRSNGREHKPMNIFEFKLALDETLGGEAVSSAVPTRMCAESDHVEMQIPNNGRWRCAYCSLTSGGKSEVRTRSMCAICRVPLCTKGSGKVDRNCFFLAHKSDDLGEFLCTFGTTRMGWNVVCRRVVCTSISFCKLDVSRKAFVNGIVHDMRYAISCFFRWVERNYPIMRHDKALLNTRAVSSYIPRPSDVIHFICEASCTRLSLREKKAAHRRCVEAAST